MVPKVFEPLEYFHIINSSDALFRHLNEKPADLQENFLFLQKARSEYLGQLIVVASSAIFLNRSKSDLSSLKQFVKLQGTSQIVDSYF